MNEFGIVYLLPRKASNYCRTLRQKIEGAFNLAGNISVPPHITIKYRFQAEDTQEVEQILQEFSASQVKTKWTVAGFDFFQDSEKFVIFMDVTPSSAARQAHARLLDSLRQIDWMQWGAFDHADAHYHVTLAHQGLHSRNFEAVWSFVNQYAPPNFEIFFDNLVLFQVEGNVHTLYKQYWLSNHTATYIPC